MEQSSESCSINRQKPYTMIPAGVLPVTHVIERGVAVNSPTLANLRLLNTHTITLRPQAC